MERRAAVPTSVMPKGVEHGGPLFALSAEIASADLSDAERR